MASPALATLAADLCHAVGQSADRDHEASLPAVEIPGDFYPTEDGPEQMCIG